MTFNIGDRALIESGDSGMIVDYHSEDFGIPSSLISHGSTLLSREAQKTGGEIVGKYKNYLIIKYLDDAGNYVQLGFLEKDIRPFKPNWREMIDDRP